MIHIRPRQLFAKLPDPDEAIRFFLPSLAPGGLTAIESVVMVALLRLVQPERVFEFGTFKGHTTRLLLENLDDHCLPGERLFTLDLASLEAVSFQGDDRGLAEESLTYPRKYLKSARRELVKQLLEDSLAFDGSKYAHEFQYIFIDGNHQLQYLARDTHNAFTMLSATSSCIIWHDYRNPQFPELTAFLDDLAERETLYHIEDTMLVAYFNGIVPAPLSPTSPT